MAYYSYYQNSQPAWGTQQYQPVAPPVPQYRPQPSWHGIDYYHAHAGSLDNTLFDYVWSKVRRVITGAGVGRDEANHWWKRVYGGLVDPSQLLPRDIGAAAGYEAIRCWEHHRYIYAQPLYADREREKEGLIGLAAAEAARLWTYTQRPLDKYGRTEASEVAASTAARIFTQTYDYDSPYEEYDRRLRRRSISDMRYGHRHDGLTRRASAQHLRSTSAVPFRGRSAIAQSALGVSSAVAPSYTVPYSTGGALYAGSTQYGGGVSYASGIPYPGGGSYVGAYTGSPAAGLGPEIPAAYYPSSGTAYQTRGYSPAPYLNRSYAGSSVGLPPPPTDHFLGVPSSTHRRAYSAGEYGAARPAFGYGY